MFIFAFTNELFDSNRSRIIIVFLIFSVCDVGLVLIKWGNITVDLVLVDICVCVVCVSGGDCVFKLLLFCTFKLDLNTTCDCDDDSFSSSSILSISKIIKCCEIFEED